jgi:tellurite resistance protein TehA-like permease
MTSINSGGHSNNNATTSTSNNLRHVAAIGTAVTAIAGLAVGVYYIVKSAHNKKTATATPSTAAIMGGCQTTPAAATSAIAYAVPPTTNGTATTAPTAATATSPAAEALPTPLTISDDDKLPSAPPAALAREHSVMPRLVSPRVSPDPNHPLILIVCGPSGVGKGTLLQMLNVSQSMLIVSSIMACM